MAQLTDDCFAVGGPLMTLTVALELLLGKLVTVAPAARPLHRPHPRNAGGSAIDVPLHS